MQALASHFALQAPVQVQAARASYRSVWGPVWQSLFGSPSGGVIASLQVYVSQAAAPPVPVAPVLVAVVLVVLPAPPLPPTPAAWPPVPVLPPLPEVVPVTVQAPSAKAVRAPRITVKDFMFMFANPPREHPEFAKDSPTVTEGGSGANLGAGTSHRA
jgi:hypothetical protein